MVAQTVVKRGPRPFSIRIVFDDYVAAALTAGTNKREWVLPCQARLQSLQVTSATAGSGAGSSTMDINKEGTTIFTTQANRPTIATADTGFWTWKPSTDLVRDFAEGDVLAYDIDAIPATTGHARTRLSIAFGIAG